MEAGDGSMVRVALRNVFLIIGLAVLAARAAYSKSPVWDAAHEWYQRTEYKKALELLLPVIEKDADTLQLIGQSYFMLADYKKAGESFEKALMLTPQSSELHHWMGRTWGRRAETASFFTAPGYASKARQSFERAVQLDPRNEEAVNDLFEYYLEAPGFLGGGIQKAEALAKHIAGLDDAEGHYAQAQLDEKKKEYKSAEAHLRRAAELAPQQVGRVVDIAKYLANRGRLSESDAMFKEALKMAPNSPKVLFAQAETLIRQKRNLPDAQLLLKRYLESDLTPDDPPREKAEELLKQIGR
jgi:tetratricopeptide (TPR) repeat protein